MPNSGSTFVRDPQCAARLSRTFSRGLSAADLAEPLLSLDENQPAEVASSIHTIKCAELAQQIVRLHRESGASNGSASETLETYSFDGHTI